MTENDEYYTGLPSFAPIPMSVSSPVIKAEDKNQIRAVALESMHLKVQEQVNLLRSQAELIMKQVKELEDRMEISKRIYEASMRFSPVLGSVYHLFENKEGAMVLSMVGPDEWGRSMPFTRYIATVRLMGDHTWEILKRGYEEII